MNLYALPPFLGGLTVASLGVFVLLKGSDKKLRESFALFSLFTALWLLAASITYALGIGQKERAFFLMRVSYTAVILILIPLIRLTSLITGSKWMILWERVSGMLVSLFVAMVWLSNWFIRDLYTHHFGYYPQVGWIHPYFLSWLFISMLSVHYTLFCSVKDRGYSQETRKQILYFWIAYLLFTPVVIDFVPNYGIDIYPGGFLFVLAFSAAAAYAIVRHQFLDIRIILRRSLVYSVLIALITAVYLVMVLVMERWFAGFFGYRSVFATAVIAFFIAVFFNPLRDRIQAFVDRALFQATTPELATQREQLLEEVRKGDQMKAVGTLAAGLAHEIKNPLASIKTFTEHLSSKHDDPQFREKFQKIVGGEVERINLIVQQLLEFAKPVPPKLTPVDASKILEDTLALLNSELLTRHVQVTKSFSKSPPILADPQQLKQVFLNLLLNSLQAMSGNGRLTLTSAPKGGDLLITLEDTGCGIAPENLNRLGEPFFSTKPAGTGLGLAVVQSIVREHQAKLQITSRVGEGTRVEMRIPLAI